MSYASYRMALSRKIGFSRSFVFRYAVTLTALLVALEMIVFGFLYWSTFAVYERGIDATNSTCCRRTSTTCWTESRP